MTCTDVLPDRAKRFLDTLAATYIDYTAEARLATNIQTEKFINGQLEEINALTDTLERQVDYYRAQNEVLDLTREQNEYFNTLVDLERQLREMEVEAESLDDLGILPHLARRRRRTPLPATSCSTTRGWPIKSANSWNSRPNATPSCSTSSPVLTKSGASTPLPSTCAATS